MKKIVLTLFVILGLSFGNTFVSSFFIKDSSIKIVSKLSNNIFINSDDINNNIIVFQSDNNIENYKLYSVCNIESDLTNKTDNLYTFDLKFLDNSCSNGNIYLKNEEGDIILNTNIKLKIISDLNLLTKLVDYSDDYLKKIYNSFLYKKNKLKIFSNLKKDLNPEFSYLQKNRTFFELGYTLKTISDLLEKRDIKYLVPVAGYNLPTKNNKIPNAGRPYRDQYTDGVHHSWDIDTDFNHPVIALDDSIIIRVVNDWKWSDFDKLKYSNNLSYTDKIYNLDVLRGNQIWLKTMKGDVVFYGHLNTIYSDIKVGTFINAGTEIGTIGITGVPDKAYSDYHLDYSIQKNPYTLDKVGKYNFFDYMTWDWYFKGESREYILNNQNNIFYN